MNVKPSAFIAYFAVPIYCLYTGFAHFRFYFQPFRFLSLRQQVYPTTFKVKGQLITVIPSRQTINSIRILDFQGLKVGNHTTFPPLSGISRRVAYNIRSICVKTMRTYTECNHEEEVWDDCETRRREDCPNRPSGTPPEPIVGQCTSKCRPAPPP